MNIDLACGWCFSFDFCAVSVPKSMISIFLLIFSTIIIRRDYLHYIPKYNRFEKRHKNVAAHISPCFRDVVLGDQVTVGQCRPLSKVLSSYVRA
jgi:ribosomal protein S17